MIVGVTQAKNFSSIPEITAFSVGKFNSIIGSRSLLAIGKVKLNVTARFELLQALHVNTFASSTSVIP